MSSNILIYGAQIISEIIWDILYFPIWWYTRGILFIIMALRDFLIQKEKTLGILVWIKNINRPLYERYDWLGQLASFLVRIVQIIGKSLVWLVWLIITFIIFYLWIVLPIFAIYEIIFQIH